ncbi:hypothetical protein JZ751_003891 [Albula glossodonta]|uniref:Uncharacterized protein n=1 Tax=Albula glossodonta TaxID=121402 RepID=A0A8T2P5R9_9TELE|nr:hypothetical protein JZ751_003891 [Albula glossodonta]
MCGWASDTPVTCTSGSGSVEKKASTRTGPQRVRLGSVGTGGQWKLELGNSGSVCTRLRNSISSAANERIAKKLKDQGMPEFKLRWKLQPNGEIFYQKKEDEGKESCKRPNGHVMGKTEDTVYLK